MKIKNKSLLLIGTKKREAYSYSVFSSNFWMPTADLGFSPRPFTIPLLYKLTGQNDYYFILFQKIMHVISSLALIVATLQYINTKLLKLIFTLMALYFFTWWNIVGWSNILLSESLSMSLLFLWFSYLLFYHKSPHTIQYISLCIVSILFSFTRDTWPYIIVSVAFLMLLYSINFKATVVKKSMYFLLLSVVLFLFQSYTANVGERYKIPLFNSITGRVAHNPEYIAWFKHEGMPLAYEIERDFKTVEIDKDYQTRENFYPNYLDARYVPLFQWIIKDGKTTYQKFLLTHPSYSFLYDQTKVQTNKIFSCTVLEYISAPTGFYLNADATFPYFSSLAIILLLIINLLSGIIINTKNYIYPLGLFAMVVLNALITYNADALEVKRHLFITQLLIDFIGLISVFLIINNLYLLAKSSLQVTNKKIKGIYISGF